MPAPSPFTTEEVVTRLGAIGACIRAQRKALHVSATTAAEAAGMSRVTLHRIERGEASVTMGAYLNATAALGLALVAFAYYNAMGISSHGVGKYLAHFAGPMPILAPLMIPIELISHMARPLSLTIRLFANMYAGEQVTVVFLKLTLLLAPALFMGLHVFVSFLQAYIFTLMTMMYVGSAVAHEH